MFGDRCPEDFKKIGILQKADNFVIWLAEHNGEERALKQVPSFPLNAQHLIDQEMTFYKTVFDHDGSFNFKEKLSRKTQNMVGLRYIQRLDQKMEIEDDTWFVMGAGRKSLRDCLYSIKKVGDHQSVKHREFYGVFQENPMIIQELIREVCNFLQVMVQFRYVHGGLSPANILVEFNEYKTMIEEIRIINFENSMSLDNMTEQLRDTVNLEYMPPEIHTLI